MLATSVVLWKTGDMESNLILEEDWRTKNELAPEADQDIQRLCQNICQSVVEHPHPSAISHGGEDPKPF
ncbi:MAG: hypothetical protein ABSD29_04065 [Verrucomicrobiota bacterium]|jgi:hypothetical protein